MKRTLAIGDIHGGLKALLQVLQRANSDSNDQLIFLGDYVDGWSEAADTIDYLIALSARQPCIFIRGNHDYWCMNWLAGSPANAIWLNHGGKTTINSYASRSKKEKTTHLHFFKQLHRYYIDDLNRLFIHAGFRHPEGPASEPDDIEFYTDRTLWNAAYAIEKSAANTALPWPAQLRHYPEIYIGHTPTINYNQQEPLKAANIWNLDTGAAFTGKLSVMDIHTQQYWQSDPLPQLYPSEKGRNK